MPGGPLLYELFGEVVHQMLDLGRRGLRLEGRALSMRLKQGLHQAEELQSEVLPDTHFLSLHETLGVFPHRLEVPLESGRKFLLSCLSLLDLRMSFLLDA